MNTLIKTIALYLVVQGSAFALTIGYINIDSLLANSQQFIDVQAEIDAEKANAEKEVSDYAEAMSKRIEDAEGSVDVAA